MAKLNASTVTNETDIKGGYDPIENGLYHVFITDAIESERVAGDDITFQIITGTAEGQEGKAIRATFWRDKEDSDSFGDGHVRLALATGLIRPGENKDLSVADYLTYIKNRQCIIKVGKRPDKNDKSKHYDCIADGGMAIWSPLNPEVAQVPKRQDWLQQGGYIQQQAAPAPAPTAAPVAAQPTAAPAPVGTPQYSV